MNLSPRDRRALAWLAVGALLTVIIRFWPSGDSGAVIAPSGNPVTLAENRLARLRETAATVASKENNLKTVTANLAAREKGMITAETAAQAEAQILQVLRRLASSETPPIEIRNTELSPIRPLGDAYGEAPVAVQFDCRIDQLVNLLAAIPAQPELLATNEVRVISANAKDKTVGVRLGVAGVVPKRLVPAKPKQGGAL